jgi:hypothetical protein
MTQLQFDNMHIFIQSFLHIHCGVISFTLIVFVKYTKLGVLGPNLAKSREKNESPDENCTHTIKKRLGIKLVFSPKLVLT